MFYGGGCQFILRIRVSCIKSCLVLPHFTRWALVHIAGGRTYIWQRPGRGKDRYPGGRPGVARRRAPRDVRVARLNGQRFGSFRHTASDGRPTSSNSKGGRSPSPSEEATAEERKRKEEQGQVRLASHDAPRHPFPAASPREETTDVYF